jgi:MFS family permease
MPILATNFGVGVTIAGLAVIMVPVGRLIMSLPGGILTQHFGRKPLLIGGIGTIGIGSLFAFFANSLFALIGFRLISGLGMGIFTVIATVYLRDISTETNRARYQSLNPLSILVGSSLGALLGGLIAAQSTLKVPFLIQTLTSGITILIIYLFLPEPADNGLKKPRGTSPQENISSSKTKIFALLLNPVFIATASLSLWIVSHRQGGRYILSPLLAATKGFNISQVGMFFFATHIPQTIAVLISGILSDRYGRNIPLIPAAFSLFGGICILIQADSLFTLLLAGVVLGIGEGLLGPPTVAYFADTAPEGLEGATMGIYGTVSGAGALIGALTLGSIADNKSIETALWIDGFVFISLIALVFIMTKSVPKVFSNR